MGIIQRPFLKSLNLGETMMDRGDPQPG